MAHAAATTSRADQVADAPPRAQLTHGVTGRQRRGGWISAVVLVVLLAGSQAAGLIGVPFTDRATGGWYDGLEKPAFNPPSWVFAPVWTTLYLLIGVAAWLVWRHGDSRVRDAALGLFTVQLALNAAWTPLFFGAESIGWAFVDLAALWVVAAGTLALFWRVDRRAAALFAPYLAWVTFAGVLNGTILAMN